MGFLKSLFKSEGSKRKLASVLSLVLGLIAGVPGTDAVAGVVTWIAGLLGISGMVHATKADTLGDHKLAGLGAIVSILVFASLFIHPLAPIVPVLLKLQVVLGGAVAGQMTVSK